jgi:long-chain acyl-CoA synthetase
METPWLKHYDPGVPATLEYPPKRVFDVLDDSAQRWPERTAILYQDRQITYLELKISVERLAQGLRQWGLQKGERVSLMLPNCPQFIIAYYAVLKAGGVISAVNPKSKAPELEFQIRDAGSVLLIALETAREIIGSVRTKLALRAVVWSWQSDEVDLAGWMEGTMPFNGYCAPQADIPLRYLVQSGIGITDDFPDIQPNEAAVFQYSGGTTGTPKAAIGLHRNLYANTLQFRRWLTGLHEGEETVLLAIPLFHVYGMVAGMSVGLMLGARIILAPDGRDLSAMLKWIRDYEVSFLPGVPTLFALLNQHPDVVGGKYDLRSIRACISGSAPLPEAVRLAFESLSGARLVEGYGLSEAPTATHCNPMLGERRAGSIGLPLPDVDCRIVKLTDAGMDVPPGEIGELILRGPQVMREYHQKPEESALAIRDGWLYTGDIARMDGDGYFYLIDRKKDLIKVGGFQVWPREIEEILVLHQAVAEAGAAGIPDPIKGEAVKAWVVRKPGKNVTQEELFEWCERSLVYYKIPVEIEFCENLPRSGVGKLLRRDLARRNSQTK